MKDIQFCNTEIIPFNEEDKLTRLDVYCITEKGEQIDVEVQILNKKNMKKRTLFYWAQMYLTTLSK
ncbi:Rpn family recombination-promoting nuclease/putative transposase [Selenomonas ruminantium]|uniref:Rpn family recombination-promoting nuclease/putative transposase n=1 Tax=Selenomonas ruminantium TaxID=971 RepID=UPI00353254FB